MKTYITRAFATYGRCTDLGAINETGVRVGTHIVGYDCHTDIIERYTNANSTWKI